MSTKPLSLPDAAELRRRAEAELRALGADGKHRPMLAKISRNVATQLRQQKKKNLLTPAAATDPQRTLHELQVHQIELEMQNLELQEARDRMEAQLEKYTDLYDFAPVGYFSLDEQGVVLEANLTGAALLGMERSRLINRRLSRFVSPANQSDYLVFLKKIFTKSGNQDCDMAMVKADGTPLWARFRGTSALSLNEARKWCRVSVSDITLLKQAEEAIARLAAIVKSSEDAIISKNLGGLITTWNRGAERLFGYLAEEAVGQPLAMIFERHHLVAGISKRILKGEIVDSFETVCRHKEGRSVDVSLTISAITDPQGRIVGVSKIMRDITERKRSEATQHRVEVLAASNLKLEAEITRRVAGQAALKQSEKELSESLANARRQQEELRLLTREVLSVQEEERKNISRELHDVIAQTLTGINIRLAALKKSATFDSADLERSISQTQKLVEHSVDIVHRFARELRPAVLDDLGLVPALHTYLKDFTARTGVRTHLTAFAGVEQLDTARRTVFFRVAQEALMNVSRHAHASRVEVTLKQLPDGFGLTIADDGKSFSVEKTMLANRGKRLGLLGMMERLEMVHGKFNVISAPGQGTTIEAQIPFSKKKGG